MVRLENIRNRSGLLLVVIGLAMLAFILTDLLSSSNGAVSTDLVLGEVGDEEIDYQAFEQRVQQALEVQRASNPSVNVDQVRNSEKIYQKYKIHINQMVILLLYLFLNLVRLFYAIYFYYLQCISDNQIYIYFQLFYFQNCF